MTFEYRIEKTLEIYKQNLIKRQKYYHINDYDLGIALKFIESYVNFLLWTLKFDNEEDIK